MDIQYIKLRNCVILDLDGRKSAEYVVSLTFLYVIIDKVD